MYHFTVGNLSKSFSQHTEHFALTSAVKVPLSKDGHGNWVLGGIPYFASFCHSLG